MPAVCAAALFLPRLAHTCQLCVAFSMASTNRLLLQALLMRLGDAVRGNDGSATDRYYRRVPMIARQHFDTNPRISKSLEQLLSVTAEWLSTDVADRYQAGQQVLEHIERVSQLL